MYSQAFFIGERLGVDSEKGLLGAVDDAAFFEVVRG